MSRIEVVRHRGVEIMVIDFANITDTPTALAAIAEARAAITSAPLNSLLTITNATKSTFDPEVVEALKQLARDDKPYVRAGAVVGATGIARLIVSMISIFSGRTFGVFDTVEQAKDWLADAEGKA